MTHEEYVSRVDELVGEEYTVIGKYIKTSTKIEMRHNVCGEHWKITPNNFLTKNKRCPNCANKNKFKSHEEFTEDVKKITNGSLSVIGEYTHCETPVKVKCNIHNVTFDKLPTSIIRGRKVCPICNTSLGEALVCKLLNEMNIDFEVQKIFKGCEYKGNLRFDFYIPAKNLLIEYDGRQHFMSVDVFGGNDAFEEQVIRDRIKSMFALENGITLVRIPYDLPEEEIINKVKEYL